MKTRISALVCFLCVFGYSDLSRAEDPSIQLSEDAYDLPTMSSGTPELYLSVMTGAAMTRSADATFTDGTKPTTVEGINYRNNFVIGGNAGVWFPTRDKLWGLDVGAEITGLLWQTDVACCRNYYNNDPATNLGTGVEGQAVYIGPNFLLRYPVAISESYPNGRWFPYVGIGVGMHQMAQRPGGFRGSSSCCSPGGELNTNAQTDQRSTTVGWMGVAGVKAHLFKYVAAFVEAKYIMAHHDALTADRFGASTFPYSFEGNSLKVNRHSSDIDTIMVNVGLSIHFDIKP